MLKKRKRQPGRSVPLAAVLVLIALTVVGPTLGSILAAKENVNQAADILSEFYLEELMRQREQMLEDSLGRYFDQLGRVVDLLSDEEPSDQEEARSFLRKVQTLIDVDKIALVDDDGIVYTAHSTFTDASRYVALQQDFTEARVIASNIYGAKKQVVLASPVQDISLQGKRLVACFMQIDIDDVIGSLNYEINGESGNTFTGLYYKNGDNLTSASFGDIEAGSNLLRYIENAQLAGDQELAQIEQIFMTAGTG